MRKHQTKLYGALGMMAISALLFAMYHPWQNAAEPASTQAAPGPQQIMINPAGQSTTLQDEIGKLQSLYSQAPETSPLRVRLLFAMGETYVKYGQVEPAITSFQQVLGLSPNDKKSHFYLGELYLYAGDTAQAITFWKRYLELDPNSYIKDSIKNFLRGIQEPGARSQ